MTVLSLVGHQESEKQARAARIESLAVNRSKLLLGAAAIEKRMRPLDPDEQARKDRADERTRRAKEDESISLYEIRKRLVGEG